MMTWTLAPQQSGAGPGHGDGELQSSDYRGPRDSERAIFAAGPRNLARATLTNESRVLMRLRLLLRRAAQPADTGDHKRRRVREPVSVVSI